MAGEQTVTQAAFHASRTPSALLPKVQRIRVLLEHGQKTEALWMTYDLERTLSATEPD